MKNQNRSEKGQVLILIALAIVALFGLIALAIDGGNAYSDRRQAQNAADAAALAASMRYTQDQSLSNNDLASVALQRAKANGYNGKEPRSAVNLTILPMDTTNQCKSINNMVPDGMVFQVDIDSYVPTWFGNIIGVSQVHNHVSARSRGCAPVYTSMFGGNTIVVLNKTKCKSLIITGSSQTTVTSSTNQGVYVNSNCTSLPTDPQNALNAGGTGRIISPSVNVVGGVYGSNIFLPTIVNTGAPTLDQKYIWPVITAAACGGTSKIINGDTLTPGVFPGDNASWRTKTFPPSGVTKLQSGLYCLDNDFKTTNTNTLNGTDLTIYQRNGNISIQGGSINLTATYAPAPAIPGLLFYMPFSNVGGYITINGGAASSYSGTILAPGANVTLNGGGDTAGPFRTQVIADTITLGGSGVLNLNYDPEETAKLPISGGIELLK